jgi:hypothetical protein
VVPYGNIKQRIGTNQCIVLVISTTSILLQLCEVLICNVNLFYCVGHNCFIKLVIFVFWFSCESFDYFCLLPVSLVIKTYEFA